MPDCAGGHMRYGPVNAGEHHRVVATGPSVDGAAEAAALGEVEGVAVVGTAQEVIDAGEPDKGTAAQVARPGPCDVPGTIGVWPDQGCCPGATIEQ